MQLTVKPDRSEQFAYNFADFPAYIGRGNIADFPNYTALGHWHDDLEFSVALEGSMDYNVNGETVRLEEGDGIFINTRQMHYNFSRERNGCEYICVLLHPMLLCASQYVEQNFVSLLLSASPYQVFRGDSEPGRSVCKKLLEIYDSREDPISPLLTQAAFFRIWAALCRNAPDLEKRPRPRSQKLGALKDMISCIQGRYQERLTLEDIARSGSVGKTSCCYIFRKYVNQSPNAYLTEYRLRKGMELLHDTDMTVTEVCYEVGLNGPSYFSESFRKAFGCSPGEYRRREKEAERQKRES